MGPFVRAPASSANLGPGFDALGMALDLYADIGVGEPPAGARVIDEHHPATIAYRASGGAGVLWERCPIPSGRGLGFSGAVRVAGAVLAHVLRDPQRPEAWRSHREAVLDLVTDLEGHADNVAASLHGGVVVTAAGRVLPVPLGFRPAVVAWVPTTTTATSESRGALPADVPWTAAVHNVGRTALLVAALVHGDTSALRDACADRLHQDVRLARTPASRVALDAALDSGAWGAWLSGSGPTIAAMCAPEDADRVAAALPADGRTLVLGIDQQGVVVEGT